jgi:hypothetical protein
MEMQSDLERQAIKEIEKRFFVEGLYYEIDSSRKGYKPVYSLYKCIYASDFGALLRSFREDGTVVGEMFVPHGAKRYVLSNQNEETLRRSHYEGFIRGLKEEAEKHQVLAAKLNKEVELAQLHLATW